MPTEVQIRNAIAARIAAIATTAKVIPRDIVNVQDGGWLSDLTDAAGKIHGWIVTLESIALREEPIGVATYNLTYSVWKVLDCETGDDTDNSEDQGSAEREAVITAFANSNVLTGALNNVGPLEFQRLGLSWVGSKCVHIDQGSIVAEWRPICT